MIMVANNVFHSIGIIVHNFIFHLELSLSLYRMLINMLNGLQVWGIAKLQHVKGIDQ